MPDHRQMQNRRSYQCGFALYGVEQVAGRLFQISLTIFTLLNRQYAHSGLHNVLAWDLALEIVSTGVEGSLCHMSPFFGTTRH